MIGRLRGRVVHDELNGACVVEVGGVGYELTVPLGTLARAALPGGAPGEVLLHVHTHVREDALDLFGFAAEVERRIFRLLLGVPNVGPRTALAVLSSMGVTELARAVESGDLARLGRVPGVGKKTAERLVLELKEKLRHVLQGPETPDARPVAPTASPSIVFQALVALGYRAAEAERALRALGARPEGETPEALLKEALKHLSS